MRFLSPWLAYSIIPVGVLSVWAIWFQFGLSSPLLLPSPATVGAAFLQFFSSPETQIIYDIFATGKRWIIAYLLGILMGLPLGLCLGYIRMLNRILGSWVDVLRSIPVTALIPFFFLVLGIDETAKIAPAVFMTALLTTVYARSSVRNANPTRLLAAKMMQIKGWRYFWCILFPETLPQLSTGFKLALSLALVLVIVSEMLMGASFGLGRRILDAQLIYDTSEMYAAILLVGILGYGVNRFYNFIEQKYIHWIGR